MPLANAVATPIINNPFAEPQRHYGFSGATLSCAMVAILMRLTFSTSASWSCRSGCER